MSYLASDVIQILELSLVINNSWFKEGLKLFWHKQGLEFKSWI